MEEGMRGGNPLLLFQPLREWMISKLKEEESELNK